MQKPILVLQMQRMGDLILSFPLMALLQKKYPNNPIWTVAEEVFFSKFYRLAPHTIFFPPSAAAQLKSQTYQCVINLSHREDAMILAGQVKTEQRYGFYKQNNLTYIGGNWPLYRASIVHNNQYNLFHWSDLYLLDHIQNASVPKWGMKASNEAKNNTIGIFVGASEREKRPSVQFFANLAKSLSHKGYKTFFFGGPEDVALGNEAMKLSNLKGSSLCGQFSLEQLATILKKLQLFITPDTGPMHLAAWMHTPILNLSLGPVNPWETGPRSTVSNIGLGHTIVQPSLDCNACWRACMSPWRCQKNLHPERIALLAHTLIKEQHKGLSRISLPNLNVYAVNNDDNGLYNLKPLNKLSQSQHLKLLIGRFWQKWFWWHFQKNVSNLQAMPTQELQELSKYHTHSRDLLLQGTLKFGHEIRQHLRKALRNKGEKALPNNFWQSFPSPIHPISGYAHLYLQNKEYSQQAWEQVLDHIEQLYNLLKKH